MSPQQQTVTFEGIKGWNVCPILDKYLTASESETSQRTIFALHKMPSCFRVSASDRPP